MRAALYVEGKEIQIILTPENEEEKKLLKLFDTKKIIKTFWGGFYKCQGGYFVEHQYEDQKDSLIFLLEKLEK